MARLLHQIQQLLVQLRLRDRESCGSISTRPRHHRHSHTPTSKLEKGFLFAQGKRGSLTGGRVLRHCSCSCCSSVAELPRRRGVSSFLAVSFRCDIVGKLGAQIAVCCSVGFGRLERQRVLWDVLRSESVGGCERVPCRGSSPFARELWRVYVVLSEVRHLSSIGPASGQGIRLSSGSDSRSS